LIEGDWQGYLSLGRGLVGGEVVVRDAERKVRGVEREVQAVKRRVEERISEVDGLLREKTKIRGREDLARRLLGVNSALSTLEKGLLLQADDYASTEDDVSLYSTDRLRRLVSQYRQLTYLISKIPRHPFLTARKTRIQKVKTTLQRDIQSALTIKRDERDVEGIFTLLKLSSTTDLSIKPQHNR